MLKRVTILERWHSFRPLSRSAGLLNTSEIASLKECYEDGETACKIVLQNGYELMVVGVADDFIEKGEVQS